jgi:hypothetical protein
MKYIITESKLNKAILEYLKKRYENNLSAQQIDCEIHFYNGETLPNNKIFTLYLKCHTHRVLHNNTIIKMRDARNPRLVFLNDSDYDSLHSLFGDLWEPIFKKWFEEITGLKIKTFSKRMDINQFIDDDEE